MDFIFYDAEHGHELMIDFADKSYRLVCERASAGENVTSVGTDADGLYSLLQAVILNGFERVDFPF